eukprot:GEMP01010764.1.p1 GENE.GEMP01010764.1~~GEMP01010764.1.p1  ORF type:complete len:288 (+),score=17.40 GEMP01010764.1:1171-2034(+)
MDTRETLRNISFNPVLFLVSLFVLFIIVFGTLLIIFFGRFSHTCFPPFVKQIFRARLYWWVECLCVRGLLYIQYIYIYIMLQLYKNEAVCNVAKKQVDIRELELDWYSRNYDTMAVQAAMFAGFAFDQITEPVPEGTHLGIECMYVLLTAVALGFSLCVCMSCTFSVIFGKGLALRGPHGTRSVHIAVDNLRRQQGIIFAQFIFGLLSYFVSHIFEVWIFFPSDSNGFRIALYVTVPLVIFFFMIAYYIFTITQQLMVHEKDALTGQIHALAPYERIRDIDQEIYGD